MQRDPAGLGGARIAAALGVASMKRFLLLMLVAGCAQRMTRMRSGWRSCQAADPNAIRCGGTEVAQVECFHPGEEACGALAIRYADGERVFLFRPFGFEPGQDE